MSTGPQVTNASNAPAAPPADRSGWFYFWTLIGINLALLALYFSVTGLLGYRFNLIRLAITLAVINIGAYPAYLAVKAAESKKGTWGGATETYAVLGYGVLFLFIGLFLLPPPVLYWIIREGNVYEEAELLAKPSIKSVPTAAGAAAAPAGTKRIFVKLPSDGRTTSEIKEVVIQTRLTPDQVTKEGALVDEKGKLVTVFYKTDNQSSYTDEEEL